MNITPTPKTLFGSGSGGVLFTDRRQFYIDPFTYSELWTSVTPFISNLYNQGNKKTLMDPNFKMFEHRNPWAKMECTIASIGAATIAAGNTGQDVTVSGVVGLASSLDHSWLGLTFEIWDATKTTKRGVVMMTNDGSNYELKNLGTANITGVIATDILVAVGSVHGEGQVAPESFSDDLRIVWGQAGIIKTAVEVTGTLYQASLRGANKELERLRKQKMELHKKKEEMSILRGSASIGTGLDSTGAISETFADSVITDHDGKVVRSSMGIITALERYGVGSTGVAGAGFGAGIGSVAGAEYQNLFDFSAGMGYNQFIDMTEKLMQYLPENGVIDFYCGPTALSFWSKIDATKGSLKSGFPIRLSDMKTDKLGYFFKYLETPFGISRLIYTPSFKREYRNLMLKVTPENLFIGEYRPFKYETNIKTDNAYDGVKDLMTTDMGLGMTLIESHAAVKTPLA